MTFFGAPAQDPNEAFDIVAFDGQPTGVTKPRAAVHRDGDWHRSVHVWVAGVDESGPFLIFQRRSLAKDTWGGKLDAMVGGHVRAGESIDDALREVEGEVGVAAAVDSLLDLGTRVCINDVEPEIRYHELQRVFLWLNDRPLLDFAPNPDELASLVRFPISALLDFFAGERSTIAGISRLPGSARLEPVTANTNDFIQTIDRYFHRIAILAERALRGERHLVI